MRSFAIVFTYIFFWMTLASCSNSPSAVADEQEITRINPQVSFTNPDRTGKAPSDIFEELSALVTSVEKMSLNELNTLSQEAMEVLITPISELRSETIRFPADALQELSVPMRQMKELIDEDVFNEDDHQRLSEEIRQIAVKFFPSAEFRGELSADQIKLLFTEWNSGEGFEETCKLLFNDTNDGVYLVPGDNLAAAHKFCENSTLFYLSDGVYYRQFIENVQNGVNWIGSGNARLDGMEATEEAFLNGMRGAIFGWFDIENYSRFGIRAIRRTGTADVSLTHLVFRNIGKEVNGQKYGAVKFEWAQNVEVSDSYFESVTSGIRFLNSQGPLEVKGNEVLNPGRNFFQCDKCWGEGIRIERNTMEHTQQYGTDKLEDFISIYESSGTESDYIRVSQNRARTDGSGEGISLSGSFIILGDHGGSYQVAEGNIGVNPGNVGVGAAGGHNIHIIDNRMYSDPIKDISNVAFYSFLTPIGTEISCSNHISSGNRAYWFCFSNACDANETALLNKAYSPDSETMVDYCGLLNIEINANESVFEDSLMTADIWNQF